MDVRLVRKLNHRHSGGSRNPENQYQPLYVWIPASAGMTVSEQLCCRTRQTLTDKRYPTNGMKMFFLCLILNDRKIVPSPLWGEPCKLDRAGEGMLELPESFGRSNSPHPCPLPQGEGTRYSIYGRRPKRIVSNLCPFAVLPLQGDKHKKMISFRNVVSKTTPN